jgi:hypothetical protein
MASKINKTLKLNATPEILIGYSSMVLKREKEKNIEL